MVFFYYFGSNLDGIFFIVPNILGGPFLLRIGGNRNHAYYFIRPIEIYPAQRHYTHDFAMETYAARGHYAEDWDFDQTTYAAEYPKKSP